MNPQAFDGSYVHVVRAVGDTFHSRCTADEFIPGVLTISSLDEPDRLPLPRVYGPGDWIEAVVVGNGHPMFGLVNAKESK